MRGQELKKFLSILGLIVVAVYFGQAIKTQKIMQLRLEDQLKEHKLTAPEFDQRLQQNSLFNILLNPAGVLKTD